MAAVIRQFPNHEGILAIVRVDILHARKCYLCDIGMINAEQITVVINDVNAVIESPHLQLLLAIGRDPVAKKSFLHFASRTRRNWNFIFASGEDEDAQANRNAEAEPPANQIR